MPSLKSSSNARGTDVTREMALKDATEVVQLLSSSPSGLGEEEACRRLEEYGPNEVAREKQQNWVQRLYVAARNPLVILLTILAVLTFATAQSKSDVLGGVVMLV